MKKNIISYKKSTIFYGIFGIILFSLLCAATVVLFTPLLVDSQGLLLFAADGLPGLGWFISIVIYTAVPFLAMAIAFIPLVLIQWLVDRAKITEVHKNIIFVASFVAFSAMVIAAFVFSLINLGTTLVPSLDVDLNINILATSVGSGLTGYSLSMIIGAAIVLVALISIPVAHYFSGKKSELLSDVELKDFSGLDGSAVITSSSLSVPDVTLQKSAAPVVPNSAARTVQDLAKSSTSQRGSLTFFDDTPKTVDRAQDKRCAPALPLADSLVS